MNKTRVGKILSVGIPLFLIVLFLILQPVKAKTLISGFFTKRIITVIIAVVLVQIFSKTMKLGGFDKKLQDAIRMITRSKTIGTIIPSALFGLLPMPAGALVSAPFTEKAASYLGLSKDKTFFINYWFRHIWEYSWPLYAGVIVGSGIMKMSVGKFALIQSPMVFISFIVGLVPLLIWTRRHPSRKHERLMPFEHRTIIEVFMPILVLFILTLVLRININIALLVAIFMIYWMSHIHLRNFVDSLKKSVFSFTTLLIITVLFLKTVIEKSGILTPVYESLVKSGISPIIVGMGIAYISGFFTGITQASVGITFPVFLSMLTQNPYFAPILYTAGFMGVMVSPFHLCYLTTKEYFHVSGKETYPIIVPATIVMILSSLFYLMV